MRWLILVATGCDTVAVQELCCRNLVQAQDGVSHWQFLRELSKTSAVDGKRISSYAWQMQQMLLGKYVI